MKKNYLIISIVVGIIIIGGIIFFLANNDNSSNDDFISDNLITNLEDDDEEIVNTNDSIEEKTTSKCSLPITNIPELAMSYGVPDGWVIEQENGTLTIMEDESNLVTAFIYTAKLEKDLSATDFLNDFGDIFKTTIEDAGGNFSLGEITEKNNVASAQVTATVAEGDLQGVFTTNKETGFITFKAYWAPVDQLSNKESTLMSIIDCYSRITVLTDADLTAASVAASQSKEKTSSTNPWGDLVSKSDGSFSFTAPSDWTSNVSSSGESTGLTLDASTGDASVAFLYNVGRYGVVDTEEFARNSMLITYGIDATLSNKQTVDDADTYEFFGTFQGKSVQGATTVRIDPYQTFFAQYLGVQIANTDKWSKYAPTLNTIQESIRLTESGQQLSNLPALPNYNTETLFGDSVISSQKYKEEVEDKSAENWSDAMRGYRTMESPSTGDTYDVPLNSYNPTGPNGGGYYRQLPGGGMEQLSPIN